jgi:alpha-beta hydrolase superfamily lysophospholipase
LPAITDFDAHLQATGTAEGYAVAADVVWPGLKLLLGKSVLPGGKVAVTGHSLGGALAALTALRISTELRACVDAVCTFGMPDRYIGACYDRFPRFCSPKRRGGAGKPRTAFGCRASAFGLA